jgi:NRAMP (natural resistance-associated macrophage protein)-like metal ion transporter
VTQPEEKKSKLVLLGPGLIAGASDDDPSGIATYSQVGAQFGTALNWTLLLSFPFMCAIQMISANIGRVTGKGLAGNLRAHYPRQFLYAIVLLLFIANAINIGANLGAMAEATELLLGGPRLVYAVLLGLAIAGLEIYVSYKRYASILKWLCLSLFTYVLVLFVVRVPVTALHDLVLPRLSWNADYLTAIVAILGTTISPYLFFWQAEQEVEEEECDDDKTPLLQAPEQAPAELRRIRLDTYIGMSFSNIIALCIMLTAALTLHVNGITNIESAAQAAEALRPIAGESAFILFALGILGTGLLSVPVLAGSAAYAVGEAFGWPVGLDCRPLDARAFYVTLFIATAVGVALNFTPINPMKALFWSAVINGVVAVPVMAATVHMASRQSMMGPFAVRGALKLMGWLTTGLMAAAVIGMLWTF